MIIIRINAFNKIKRLYFENSLDELEIILL